MTRSGVNWSVRPALEADVDALALIGKATFLETFAGVLEGDAIVAHCERAHSPAAYRAHLSSGALAWLAEIDPGAAPIAFALAGQPDLPESKAGDIELKRIYVLSRFHGSGAGAALLSAVSEAVAGYRRLLLGVYAGNTRAQAFYHKNGFEKIADRQFDVGGTLYDDIVMAKSLAS